MAPRDFRRMCDAGIPTTSGPDELDQLRHEMRREFSQAIGRALLIENDGNIGIIEVVEALILGLIEHGVVPPDFLITTLAQREKFWRQPADKYPDGLKPLRADVIESVLVRLDRAHRTRTAQLGRGAVKGLPH